MKAPETGPAMPFQFDPPIRRVACLLILVAGTVSVAGAESDGGLSRAELHRRVSAAAVEVLVEGRLAGSGWIADEAGDVVTAAHVVHGRPKEIEIRSPSLGRLDASVLALDPGHDLALLQLPGREKPYPHLRAAEHRPPPGTTVYFFGSAVFRHRVMLRGIIARQEPTFEFNPDLNCYVRALHITAPSPKGTSGGGWVDDDGSIVANQSGFVGEGVSSGIAIAAPADAIRNLIEAGQAQPTATLGIMVEELWTQPPGFIGRFPEKAEGVVVHRIFEKGPAARSSLEREMLITHAAGQRSIYRDDLLRAIRRGEPGQPIRLKAMRPDTHETVRITVPRGRVSLLNQQEDRSPDQPASDRR